MAIQLEPRDAFNEEWIAQAHPPNWRPPIPSGRYNLVVLGAGTAGLVAAAGAAGLGAKVALIERELMGGDCLNFGCVPSKAILRSARAAHEVQQAEQFSIRLPGPVTVDFPRIMERMRRLRAGISHHDSAERFRSLGIDVFLGSARFTGPDVVSVDGTELRFSRAVIATGARAARPDISGLEATGYRTNETIFSLTELPTRLVVVGAGPIGCELAQAFARFGSEVTMIAKSSRVLMKEDPDVGEVIAAALRKDGVRLCLGRSIDRVERDGSERVVHLAGTDEPKLVRADDILVATGRVPNVEGMGLESAGVDFDLRRGVVVDDFLRTTNPRVYAAGDVCSSFQFTHAADFMARTVLRNALFRRRARLSALTIPWCTFTDPEVAHVGLSEEDAAQRNIAVDVYRESMRDVDRAVLDDATEGFVKILCAKGSDRILGATLVAPHAGESIGTITLAMAHGIGLGKIANVIHPYPTQAEAIRKLGDRFNRTRMTPWVRWAFAKWLAWQR